MNWYTKISSRTTGFTAYAKPGAAKEKNDKLQGGTPRRVSRDVRHLRMKRRIKRAAIIIAALIVGWFPIALLAELGRNPYSGVLNPHPIGSIFAPVKRLLELPFLPFNPVNSATLATLLYLGFWTPVIWLAVEMCDFFRKKRKGLPNQRLEATRLRRSPHA